MSTATSDEEVVECVASPADPLDVFFLEWARESLKRNLPFVNEVLRLLVTLSTSVLAGSVALLRDQVYPAFFIAVTFCFLAALSAALWGVLPYEGVGIPLFDPEGIARHKQRALVWKIRLLKVAAGFLVLGVVVALVGLLMGKP